MRGGRDWVPAFAGTRQPIRRGGTGPDSLDHPIVAVQHRSIMATLASSSVPAITQNPDIRYLGRLLGDVIRAYGGEKIYKQRSEERRVGKECVSTCRSRWSPHNSKKKKKRKKKE